MPRRIYKKRASRPRSKMYRRGRRTRVLKTGKFNQGYMYVRRKLPMCVIRTKQDASGTGTWEVNDDGVGTLVQLGTPAPSTGLPAGWQDLPFSISFALNQVTAYSEFQALFDEYKIHSASVKISPNTTIAQSGTSQNLPYIEWISDHDDSVPPNIVTFREKMGIHTKFFNSKDNSTTMICKPRPVTPVYSFTGGSYQTPNKAPWIDATNASVTHYAIKGVIRHLYNPNLNYQTQITLDASLGMSFKGVQ